MDCQASAGSAQVLLGSRGAPDVASGRPQFIPEQYHSGSAVRRHRQDVGQETGDLAFQTADSFELCLWHGRRMYSDRHTAEPDYFRTLYRPNRDSDECVGNHPARIVLPFHRHPLRHRDAPPAARPQGSRDGIRGHGGLYRRIDGTVRQFLCRQDNRPGGNQ